MIDVLNNYLSDGFGLMKKIFLIILISLLIMLFGGEGSSVRAESDSFPNSMLAPRLQFTQDTRGFIYADFLRLLLKVRSRESMFISMFDDEYKKNVLERRKALVDVPVVKTGIFYNYRLNRLTNAKESKINQYYKEIRKRTEMIYHQYEHKGTNIDINPSYRKTLEYQSIDIKEKLKYLCINAPEKFLELICLRITYNDGKNVVLPRDMYEALFEFGDIASCPDTEIKSEKLNNSKHFPENTPVTMRRLLEEFIYGVVRQHYLVSSIKMYDAGGSNISLQGILDLFKKIDPIGYEKFRIKKYSKISDRIISLDKLVQNNPEIAKVFGEWDSEYNQELQQIESELFRTSKEVYEYFRKESSHGYPATTPEAGVDYELEIYHMPDPFLKRIDVIEENLMKRIEPFFVEPEPESDKDPAVRVTMIRIEQSRIVKLVRDLRRYMLMYLGSGSDNLYQISDVLGRKIRLLSYFSDQKAVEIGTSSADEDNTVAEEKPKVRIPAPRYDPTIRELQMRKLTNSLCESSI